MASSPEVWRAVHREAFRWERVSFVCFCGAAVICLLTLRSWHLVLAESILYCGYLIPFGFNGPACLHGGEKNGRFPESP